MPWYLMAGLVVFAAVAIYFLLARVSARGGSSKRDAADVANQILAEANGFRGSGSPEDPPWDGHNRLAPPTQEGGF